jgi:DNA-binding transcriptional regulator YiaG
MKVPRLLRCHRKLLRLPEYSAQLVARILAASPRERLGMSQAKVAKSFGLEVSTVQNWKHGRRHPESAERVLLRVIERDPKAVQRAPTAG